MNWMSASLYQPISSQRLSDAVQQQLMLPIVRGAMEPGASLPTEAELSEQFRVSRTVVREAVRALVAKGLVKVRTRTGTQVTSPEQWDYLDPFILFERVRAGQDERLLDSVFELRRAIEVEAAASAAVQRTHDDLRVLSTTLDAMRACLDDPPTYIDFDIEFHNAILAASNNRLFQQALRPVSRVLKVGRFISGRRPGALPESQQGHEEIFAAIQEARKEEAGSAMRRHIEQFEGDIRIGLREGVPDGGLALEVKRVGAG